MIIPSRSSFRFTFSTCRSIPTPKDGSLSSLPRRVSDKVLGWPEARAWREARERESGARGGRVVFTNGVFDLLHPGHIDVLAGARAQGDWLVVGLNSDGSVRRLKGTGRPVRAEGERAYVLAALEVVDVVVIFEQDTPLELVKLLQPDVIVKGGDYAPDEVVGAEEVRARGGDVVIVPLTPGQSTSSIIERLRDRER